MRSAPATRIRPPANLRASTPAVPAHLDITESMARGTIGWPEYPKPTPSTLDYTTIANGPQWLQPRWSEVWFPDAFVGTMAQLLVAIEDNTKPEIDGRDNLATMALVDAAYLSAREHRAVSIDEITLKHGAAYYSMP